MLTLLSFLDTDNALSKRNEDMYTWVDMKPENVRLCFRQGRE